MRKRANRNRIAAAILTMSLLIPALGTSVFAASSVNITKEANELQLDLDRKEMVDDDTYYSNPVTITSQPENVTVKNGQDFTFRVNATGINLTYRWQFSADEGSTWIDTDCLTAEYTGIADADMNGNLFRCIVTDGAGNAVTSTSAKLTVNTSTIVITSQPQDVITTAGEIYVISVAAEGNGLTYLWQNSRDEGNTWYNTSRASNNYPRHAYISENGRMYRCVITDADGNVVYSNAVKLTVIENAELVITSHPADLTVNEGDTFAFAVAASGNGLTYQWQYSDNSGSSWSDIDCTTAQYTGTAAADISGRMFRCVVTGEGGNIATSDSAKLTVNTSPIVITSQPQDVITTAGEIYVISVAAEGNGLTYLWQISRDEGNTWYNTSRASNNYPRHAYISENGRMYRCVITDADGNQVISDAAKLIITVE